MEKLERKAVSGSLLALWLITVLTLAFNIQPTTSDVTIQNAASKSPLKNDIISSQNSPDTIYQSQSGSLTPQESQVVALVNGTRAYDYALKIEQIGLNHTLSNYSFRAAGSSGANETAKYIMKQFQSFGLETHNESFQFTNWDLSTPPTLIIDEDGNPATTNDQTIINSFQSTHYSWPTPIGGVFRDLVILPLPAAASRQEIGMNPIDMNAWNAIDTTGKILLIGQEVRWNGAWQQTFINKLYAQPPAGIVFTWWYNWMSFTPMMYNSAGGRPISGWGPYFWNLQIPVGGVDYQEGLWIRNRESTVDVSASFKIESVIGSGPHYNVIGKLRGYAEPEKFVIVSGHYDTVTTPAFGDNGAGTAGVIELAKVLTDAVKNGLYYPKYSILFIAFTSEEAGLVGSIYYIKQHKAEMTNVVAVINLDCIGSDDFYVSETDPADGLDLDQLVLQAAADLGIGASLIAPGGSDQESFRDPSWANWLLQYWWGIDPNIGDATPVNSSAVLISEPLMYSDIWSTGKLGWIHTSYDNSSSTQTLNWIEIADLQDHIKIAALSILRVSPQISGHNIAVINVTGSKTVVCQGYSMQINVTVRNQGVYDENFNVVLQHDHLAAPTPAQWDTFWSLGDVNRDGYIDGKDIDIIVANFGWVGPPGENPADINSDGRVEMSDVLICAHNYAFDIWTHFGLFPSPIGKQAVVLAIGASTTLTLTWNTLGWAKGNYAISAYATAVPNETDTADNTRYDSLVTVAMVGDITGPTGVPDGKVEIRDVALVCKYFGQKVPPALANCDIDNNGKVEIKDIAIVAKNFGKTDPP